MVLLGQNYLTVQLTGRYTTGSSGHTAADTAMIFGGYDGSAKTATTGNLVRLQYLQN